MEKRLFLAALLSLAVLLAWGWLMPTPARPPEQSVATPSVASTTAPSTAPVAPAAKSENEALPPATAGTAEETLKAENGLVRATVSNRGGVITSFVLLQHTDEKKQPLELLRQLPLPAPRTLGLEFPGSPELTQRIAQALFVVEKEGDRTLRL